MASIADYHAAGVITHRERAALELRYDEHGGLSYNRIALALGISRWAARDRCRSGLEKIARHKATEAA